MEGDIGGGEWETLNLKSTTATPLRARVLMQLANETASLHCVSGKLQGRHCVSAVVKGGTLTFP